MSRPERELGGSDGVGKRVPHLVRRGNFWWFQRRIPLDLVDAYGGKKQLLYSLGRVSNHEEAIRRVEIERLRTSQEFEAKRREVESKRRRPVDDTELERLALLHFQAAKIPDVPDFEMLFSVLANPMGADRPVIEATIDELCEEHRLTLTPPQRERLGDLLRRSFVELNYRKFVEDDPRPARDPLFTEVPPAVHGLTVDGLIDAYLAEFENTWAKKTQLKYQVMFTTMRQMFGPRAAISISRADCREMRDTLAALPTNLGKRRDFKGLTFTEAADRAKVLDLPTLHPATINSYLDKLNALFAWGVAEGMVPANPAKGLRVAESKNKLQTRQPFTTEQLRLIFNAPIYTGCRDDERGWSEPGTKIMRRGRYWVPLIALFNGMRLNEICQLETADTVYRDRTWCIRVTAFSDETGEAVKRIKNTSSDRLIPVHPMLERLGFLHHVDAARKAKRQRLFPELEAGPTGYFSHSFSRWFGRFLGNIGAKTLHTSFHSFRHSYRDALRDTDIPHEVKLSLGGWSDDSVAAQYGLGFRPSLLRRELAKLSYPQLDLSHLYRVAGEPEESDEIGATAEA